MSDETVGKENTGRDWGTTREWMNVLAAVGALLVGVVSLWTTAQISGLEDYFRSEIKRRNSDLNTLAAQSRRLNTLADERSNELAKLQTTTDAITALNLAAQGRLIATQQELTKLGFEVAGARQTLAHSEARLTSLAAQSSEQVRLIDRFRRKHFYERASMRIFFVNLFSEEGEVNLLRGERVYQSIVNLPASEVNSELIQYLPEFTANARSTCQWIRSYNPEVPRQVPYPKGPAMPGKPSEDGRSKLMTDREYKQWIAQTEDWNKRWSEVSATNRAAFEQTQRIREYLSEAAANCICRALVNADNSASEICPGRDKPPQRPESITK